MEPAQSRNTRSETLQSGQPQSSSSAWIRKRADTLKQNGVLQGTHFAVKGMIAVAGDVPTLGCPAYDAELCASPDFAACVLPLLEEGATLDGTTVLDELALGVTGANPHTGTPINPKAPDRVPGGSSSGSAVVVAAGDVDFALGTDTGGSIRVPASWCGVFGWRPTHGVISMEGVPVHSPTLDVIGIVADSLPVLERVGAAYGFKRRAEARAIAAQELLIVRDLADLCDAPLWNSVRGKLKEHEELRVSEITLAELLSPLSVSLDLLTQTMFHIGLFEVASARAAWAEAHRGKLGEGVLGMLDKAKEVDSTMYREALALREAIQHVLSDTLEGRVLIFPTTPGPAPLRDSSSCSPADTDNMSIQALCALSSVTGLPQLSVPFTDDQSIPPNGLSLVGNSGADMDLFKVGQRLLSCVAA